MTAGLVFAFLIGATVHSYTACMAYRGRIFEVYDLPEVVRFDPDRRRQTNAMFMRWAALAAGIMTIPAVYLTVMLVRDPLYHVPLTAGLLFILDIVL